MSLHAINKQAFEVNCRNEEVAKNVQLEIENYTSFQINTIINSVLNEIVASDSQLKIDKIEIDLGDMSMDEFGDVGMLENFKSMFREKVLEISNHENKRHRLINGNVSRVELLPDTGNDWELIRSFLLNGDLPWWTNKNTDIDINGTLQKLTNLYPETVKTFLYDHKQRLDVLWRLNDQLKPATRGMINSLIPGLLPESINREIFRSDYDNYPNGFLFSGELFQKFNSLPGNYQPESIDKRRNRLLSGLGKIIKLAQRKDLLSNAGLQGFEFLAGELIKEPVGNQGRKIKEQLARYIQRLSVIEIEFLLLQVAFLTGSDKNKSAEPAGFDVTDDNDAGEFISNDKQLEIKKNEELPGERRYTSTDKIDATENLTGSRKFMSGMPWMYEVADHYGVTGYRKVKKETGSPGENNKIAGTGSDDEPPGIIKTPLTFSASEKAEQSVDITKTLVSNDIAVEPENKMNQEVFIGVEKQTWQQYPGDLKKGSGQQYTEELKKDTGNQIFKRPGNEKDENFSGGLKKDNNFFLSIVRILAYLKRHNTDDADKNDLSNAKNEIPEKYIAEENLSFSELGAEELQKDTGDVLPPVQQGNAVSSINKDSAIVERQHDVSDKEDKKNFQVLSPVSEEGAAVSSTSESHLVPGKDNKAELKPQLPEESILRTDDTLKSAGQLKARKIAFIMRKLNTSDTVLHYYLKQLDETALNMVEKTLRQHVQEHKKLRQTIRSITENPHFLKYEILKVYANIYFDNDRDAESAIDQPGVKLNKKKEALLIHFSEKIQISLAAFLLLVDKLSSKEIILLTDIFRKQRCDNLDESRILRKILYKLPEEAVFLIKFLTELPEKKIMELTSLNRNKLVPGFESEPQRANASAEGTIDVGKLENELPGNESANKISPNELKNRQSEVFYKEDPAGKIYIENAGLCVIALYLRGLFNNLGYLEKGSFKNRAVAARAVFILQYIVSGKKKCAEYLLQFNKVLCGFRVNDYPGSDIRLTKKEMVESDMLLQSVIEHWKALKNTSLAGLRESFIQRKGILLESELNWTLQVERKGYDLLLNTIPWGFNIIKLPWMKKHIRVEW